MSFVPIGEIALADPQFIRGYAVTPKDGDAWDVNVLIADIGHITIETRENRESAVFWMNALSGGSFPGLKLYLYDGSGDGRITVECAMDHDLEPKIEEIVRAAYDADTIALHQIVARDGSVVFEHHSDNPSTTYRGLALSYRALVKAGFSVNFPDNYNVDEILDSE
ncbi:hypothetical protein GCM10023063_18780 [Arthrobacter methylotrophus]|uniref:DUF4265 domain-containing protein n=1 Tax=Arthrobacter methylotrophus TaxID=121291 RepID=A0ABV5UP30_9MICC